MRAHAHALRRDMTLAERIIWRELRAHRLNGAGFRRQAPIGPYIVDFVSHSAMLIIEIDGGQHFEDAHEARDASLIIWSLAIIASLMTLAKPEANPQATSKEKGADGLRN